MTTRPDIILIVADDINYSLLLKSNCPTLKGLMSSGLNFTNAYNYGGSSGAVCKSSRLMMLYGEPWNKFGEEHPFPEILKNNGYDTFATGKWHSGSELLNTCFNQKNEVFLGGMLNKQSPLSYSKYQTLGNYLPGGIFSNSLINYIKSKNNQSKPYFAYIGFTEPHDPLRLIKECVSGNNASLPINFKKNHPFNFGQTQHRDEKLMKRPLKPKLLKKHLLKYQSMMTYLDKQVGKIMKAITRPTVIIFTTDNGICKGNHGLLGKQNLYQESIHIPLFVWSNGLNLHSNTNKMVYLYDIYASILSLAGIQMYYHYSQNLFSNQARTNLTFKFKDDITAIISDNYKLIHYLTINKYVLYQLANDPYELHPLNLTKYNDIFKTLKALLNNTV